MPGRVLLDTFMNIWPLASGYLSRSSSSSASRSVYLSLAGRLPSNFLLIASLIAASWAFSSAVIVAVSDLGMRAMQLYFRLPLRSSAGSMRWTNDRRTSPVMTLVDIGFLFLVLLLGGVAGLSLLRGGVTAVAAGEITSSLARRGDGGALVGLGHEGLTARGHRDELGQRLAHRVLAEGLLECAETLDLEIRDLLGGETEVDHVLDRGGVILDLATPTGPDDFVSGDRLALRICEVEGGGLNVLGPRGHPLQPGQHSPDLDRGERRGVDR